MATFNLQNNVVNAFFLKRRRREVNFCAVATLNSYVKRSRTARKMHHHGYVKAAFWCEKRCCKIMQNLVHFHFYVGFGRKEVTFHMISH